MAELKTKKTKASVTDFINGLGDPKRVADCKEIISIMKEVTGERPRMWGASMVGFGDHHYRYESGREGDLFLVGFSPRKSALTLYLWWMAAFPDLLEKLGTYKKGKGCLYIKRMEDVDRKVLKKLVSKTIEKIRQQK